MTSCYILVCTFSAALSANLGKWGETITFNMVPVAAALHCPTNELILWAAFKNDSFQQGAADQTVMAKYNIKTKVVSELITVSNSKHDMFCPGTSLTFDGSIIVTGGDTAPKTSIYNGNWAPGGDMNIPRGYQGSVTLSDGRVFIIGGSWSGSPNAEKNGEVWDPETSTWSLLPGCLVKSILTNDKTPTQKDNHPWIFAWTNGSVFHAGPSSQINWYDTSGNGSVTPAGKRAEDGDSMSGNAVMYDAVAGKIFTAGGSPTYHGSLASSNAHIITIGKQGEIPLVKKIKPMKYARAFANSVVLPDGTIFIIGGQTYAKGFTDSNSSMIPELWNPETETFIDLAEGPTPRNYHSVALLMTGGTVFSGGGGLGGDCGCNHPDGQFYWPPYLFEEDGETFAKRPTVQSIPKEVKVGSTIEVSIEAVRNGPITFSLVRAGSSTHTVNTDQRRVPLKTTSTASPFTFTLPSDPGVLIPGFWMFFALENGVPSVGKFVKVTLDVTSDQNSKGHQGEINNANLNAAEI